MASTDGFCPFKDKKAISMWPFVLTVLNLPLSMRYKLKNALFMSIGTGPDNRQPTNFPTHHDLVAEELIRAARGWDININGTVRRVRLIVPIFSCDGRGTHFFVAVTYCAVIAAAHAGREKVLGRTSSGAYAGCACGECFSERSTL
jgi:hypothetical protein